MSTPTPMPSGPSPFSDAGAVIPQGTPTQPLPIASGSAAATIVTPASQAATAAAATSATATATDDSSSCKCTRQKTCVTHFMCWLGAGILFIATLVLFMKYKNIILTQKISK